MFFSNIDSLGYQSFKGASWALVLRLHLGETIKGLLLVLSPLLILTFGLASWACARLLFQTHQMSYSNDYFLLQNYVSFVGSEFSGSHRRLRTPSYNFTSFHRWTHVYNQKYQIFHLRGYLSLLTITRHIFSCSLNSGTPLNFVQRIEPNHQPPRMVCDGTNQGWCVIAPCTYTHEMRCLSAYAMHYAISYQFHVSYVMNAIWKIPTYIISCIMINYVRSI